MALESNPNQAFLANNTEDDLAALDSMAFTGTQSQFGMNTVTMTPGSSFGAGGSTISSDSNPGRISDGRDGGFSGVSESLFDRIRARTAEQQKQSMSAQSSGVSSTQEAAQSSQQQPSAFMSQQPSSEPTMEHEKTNNSFGGNVDVPVMVSPADNQNILNANNNETTYSFTASAGGEDFSQAAGATAPHVPQYGPSRDDPYYAAMSNQQQQHPASIQDKASMALAQTGETMKSLLGAGLSGAQAIGAMAQQKMGGGGGGSGERSYNNNFLLREDSVEEGNALNATATMSQPPPPAAATTVASGAEAGSSGQAYSMLSYGKTFCEDMIGFVMQLPPWGKGLVAVILLWVIYAVFGG